LIAPGQETARSAFGASLDAGRGVLRFLTAGGVDDGKSTLIGRMLYDAQAILEDQLASVERASAKRGAPALDLSLLTDGLEAEREQGITIDVAYRYFATPRRKFIIADTPGHEQYTRNMATGASTADAVVLVADAARGLQPQTARHLRIARLLGIGHAIVFVNKMDLVGYACSAFTELRRAVEALAAPLGFATLDVLPGSALHGDMVAARGTRLAWYRGPTLLERLESLDASHHEAAAGPLRFPVQLAARPVVEVPRTLLGRLESGVLIAGSEVVLYPGARRTRVREIRSFEGAREIAEAGDSVALVLTEELDVARGDLLAGAAHPPRETMSLEAQLIWLDREPLRPGRRYLVQHAARRVLAQVEAGRAVGVNDIAGVRLALQAPLFVDPYAVCRATGGFILIDEATNRTVAAGLVQ
jgi:sulfate adenylyltransferase large subunit